MCSERGLFIDGAWRRRGGAGENPVLDPATGEPLGDVPMASADDTRDAIAKALAEENFGPIAAIVPFAADDEVYARANDSIYGLSGYAFTRSPRRARDAVGRIQSGMVGINSFALAAAEAPFGGIKYSGMGREGRAEGIADRCDTKLGQVALP